VMTKIQVFCDDEDSGILWLRRFRYFVIMKIQVFCDDEDSGILWWRRFRYFVMMKIKVFCDDEDSGILWWRRFRYFVMTKIQVFCDDEDSGILWWRRFRYFVMMKIQVFWYVSLWRWMSGEWRLFLDWSPTKIKVPRLLRNIWRYKYTDYLEPSDTVPRLIRPEFPRCIECAVRCEHHF
jgi:hypothetical protein